MKKNLTNLFAFFALAIVVFTGCGPKNGENKVNDAIDKQIRADINTINKKLFRLISERDIPGAKQIMSAGLLQATEGAMDTIINAIADRFVNPDFTVVDEYYTHNKMVGHQDTLESGHGDDGGYIISFKAMNEEMYVSLLTPVRPDIKCLVFIAYGKYGDDWKINIIRAGEYTYFDKKAPDFYKQALEQYQKGYMIDAALSMVNASQIAHPASEHFWYKKDDEMKAFFEKVMNETNAKYDFPITVDEIKTRPNVYFVNPQYVGDEDKKGIYPIVTYVSSIKLTDTIALKAENNELHKYIGGIFNGIDKNNNYITYSVSHQVPDGKTLINTYGFVQKVK